MSAVSSPRLVLVDASSLRPAADVAGVLLIGKPIMVMLQVTGSVVDWRRGCSSSEEIGNSCAERLALTIAIPGAGAGACAEQRVDRAASEAKTSKSRFWQGANILLTGSQMIHFEAGSVNRTGEHYTSTDVGRK